MLGQTPNDRYEDIVKSTAGVVFLGTPHRGMSQAIEAFFLAGLASYIGSGVRSHLLEDIKPGSRMLDELVDQFARLARKLPMEIFCFFEQHKTDYLRPVRPSSFGSYPQREVRFLTCTAAT